MSTANVHLFSFRSESFEDGFSWNCGSSAVEKFCSATYFFFIWSWSYSLWPQRGFERCLWSLSRRTGWYASAPLPYYPGSTPIVWVTTWFNGTGKSLFRGIALGSVSAQAACATSKREYVVPWQWRCSFRCPGRRGHQPTLKGPGEFYIYMHVNILHRAGLS